ncbi:hypothetical protein AB1N83_007879 [Pleurotus pulmonarius]
MYNECPRLGTLQDWDKTRATRILKLNSPCGRLALDLTMSHAPTTDIEANKITQTEETVTIDIWQSLRYLGIMRSRARHGVAERYQLCTRSHERLLGLLDAIGGGC